MTNTYPLSGRGAIITGANQGLGKVIAEHYVRAGADVLLTARDEALLRNVQKQLQGVARGRQKVLIQKSDVSDRKSCAQVVERAADELAGFQILVNNAGVYGPKGPIEEVDWDEWVKAIEINLF